MTHGLGDYILEEGINIIEYEEKELENPIAISATSFGGESNDYASVTATNDGGYIVGGSFESSSITVGNYTLISNNSDDYENDFVGDGLLIKYDANNEVEWATSFGGEFDDGIGSVAITSEGGYIVGGYFDSDSITVGDYTFTNNDYTDVTKSCDGLLIKYSEEGNVEWATSFGGNDLDIVTAVVQSSDGGYVVGGYFRSSSITVGGYTLINNGELDGFLIKYSENGEVEWATSFGGNDLDIVTAVVQSSDGGYVVGGYFESSITVGNYVLEGDFRSSTGLVVKYDEHGKVNWATKLDEYDQEVTSIIVTADDGYMVMSSSVRSIYGSNSYIYKYSSDNNIEWQKKIPYSDGLLKVSNEKFIVTTKNQGIIQYKPNEDLNSSNKYIIDWQKQIVSNNNYYNSIGSVAELQDGTILVVGTFESETIEIDGITLTNSLAGFSDVMLLKIANMTGVPEVEELEVKNYRKEFKITTDVEEIDGQRGGDILGEDQKPYETVKYGDSSKLDIIMTPEDNTYEIIKVTINGVEQSFTPAKDGSYTLDKFQNMKENKHVVVTYAKKSNKIVIKKEDSKTKSPMEGIEFKLEQIDEKVKPQEIIGELTENSSTYLEADRNQDVTDTAKGKLTPNGETYTEIQTGEEIKDIDLTPQDNGDYHFIPQEGGSYVSNNGKNQTGTEDGISDTTADSYVKIDLTGKEGQYVVVVNASVSSEYNYDCGYLAITDTQNAPEYISEGANGIFMYKSGEIEATDYTSELLNGENTYYLHLGYQKDVSSASGDDEVVIHSIKLYKANIVSSTYNFVDDNGVYKSNNQGKPNTTANSYIPINLEGKDGEYIVVVDASISSQEGNNYGYATITTTETAQEYYSAEKFINISGSIDSKEYISSAITGGDTYYLHLGYYKDEYSGKYGDDQFVINSVKIYKAKEEKYNFINDNGVYKSTNQGKPNTTANSYIPINLSGYQGKYDLTISAKVSSLAWNDHGYAEVTTDQTAPKYENWSSNRFVDISGTSNTEYEDYTTTLEGGYEYYLHLGYYKNVNGDDGEDTFWVKNIRVTINSSELYNTSVVTNKEGTATTQLPYGRYSITEVNTPEGYVNLEKPIVIDFKEDTKGIVEGSENAKYENEEYVISNTPLSKVTVHHYLKEEDGTETKQEVAPDDFLYGKEGEEYGTRVHLDLEKYEPEKNEDGTYKVPEGASGNYGPDDKVVTYYYVEKKIPLTVHHYIEGTEKPVPLANGSEAEDVTTYEKVHTPYTTKAKTPEELNPQYELTETPSNSEGTYEYEEVEVTYFYDVKDSPGVVVHHKEQGTGKTLSADVTLPEDRHTAKYGDPYKTEPATDIPENYKLVETPTNANGTMIDKLTEVTYEYELKDPKITNQTINKTGTESIETKDAEVSYTVNYNVTVSEYIGQAQITIVDTLPYPIDLSKSDLDNGTYDEEKHTITWQEVIDIDTYKNGVSIDGSEEKGITLTYTKDIKVVFSSMDYTRKEIENNVNGKIKLYTPEKESEPVEDDTTTETNFTTEVTAVKIWDHGKSIYEKPTQVKLQVMKTVDGEEQVVKDAIVTLADNKVDGDENRWSYTFTDLPKYDDLGNEIEYKIGEAEVESGELLYYNTSIDQAQKTVTNTYIGPVISSKKESSGKNGKDYVIEAETITYTITVTNEGGVGKDVVIKDTVPVGTTFVKGSIKVNGEDSYKLGEATIQLADKTEQDLANGITVNVPKKENETPNDDGSMQEGKNGQVTLSFDVTVNDLPDGEFIGEITNTATVDDTPTGEVKNTIKKPNISFEKKAEVERGVASWEKENTVQNPDSDKKVKENDTITYKIVLTNSGEAEGTAIVKDAIPTGTEFVAGSIKVAENSEEDNQELSEKTEDDLANEGISVVVGKGETKTLEFKVKVKNLNDQQMIRNTATVNNNSEKPENPEKETNVVEHKYVEPIISENKTHTTDESLSYVLEEEGVTFTIVAENAGGLAKDVVIKDKIPSGTSFIPGSIKVNGASKYTYRGEEIDLSNKTAKDLNEGISVTVPAKAEGEVDSEDNGQIEKANGQANLSFKVKIDELPENIFTRQITNTAKVDEKDTNEDKVLVNKTNVTYKKTSDPETGSKVIAGDIITYRIEAQNTGTAPADIEIYDSIPEGTTYVEGSLSVKQGLIATVRRYVIDDLTKTGIDIKLKDGEKVVVEFKVKVNEDLKNGTVIRNVAEINGSPTEDVEHTVEAPNLAIQKEQKIETGENYVVKGDVIEYSIILRNDGALGTKAIIKDNVPEGTSFVAGSMRINDERIYTLPRELERGEIKGETDEIDVSAMTEEDLKEGIEVYIGKQTELLPETLTLSFKVKVNEDAQGEIRNVGQVQEEREPQETTDPSLPPVIPTVSPSNPVDPENPDTPDKNLKDPITSNEVKCPVVTFEKQVEIHRTTEEDQPNIGEGKVTAEDELTYKVIVRNTGEETAKNVEVKDTIPEGTIIKEVNDEGQVKSDKEITWVIEEIPAGKEKTVSFTVTVGYAQQDREIKNTAYVKGVETNETVTEYKKPEIKLETTVVKTGDYKITSTDTPVYYELTYTATIDCFVGKATIKIVDELPYEIDEGASSLDGGKYDKATKTITWEEETDEIDTYLTKEAQVITRHKELSLKYIYEDEENLHGDIENTVKTTTDLKEPDPENPREDKVVKTEEQEDKHIVVAEIPTTLTVHHYFYDKELEQETKVELAPDEVKEGLVGDEYTTSKSSKVPANYECMNENPEKKEGTLTKTPIEVTYYYILKDETAKVEVTKEATADKKVEKEEYVMDEEGRIETNEDGSMKTRKVIVPVITNEDGSITYKITYKVRIENYIGKAKVEIVDRLPAGINKEASELKEGSYDEVAHTITWEEEIEDIDTFARGTYEKTIEKEITVVYEGQNKASILENTVEGKVTTYYPDIHPNKPGEEKQEITDEDEETVEQDYRTDVTVEKRWDDNENVKHHRPASVKVYLTANGAKVSVSETQFAEVILSEENSWTHTFENLPKYNNAGNMIVYSVEENEVNANDLEYYEDANINIVSREKTLVKVIVTNSYRLVNTEIESSITKNGTESITSSKQEVNYHVEYHAVVKDYIGESTLTVTDTLPYRIDKEKSELKGGKYDDDLQTITWTEDLGHINTVENGEREVDFEKDIKVVFKDLDASQYEMTNHVKGRIEFTENDTKNEVEDSHITNIDVQGKVVVKYVDILTGKEITRVVKPGEEGNEEGQEDKEITYGYEIEQKVGTDYRTEQKTIPTYDYVKNSGNTEGKIIEGTIEVTYYYIRSMSGGLTVRYVDEEGNDLLPEVKKEGRIDDPYTTEEEEIENYECTGTTGDEKEGKFGVEPKEVVYHYRKIPAKVVVRYLEKETEEVLLPEKIIEGYVGDPYETTREAVENYRAAEPEPENSQGKMEKNDEDNTIYVTYYYEKIPSGKITAKYVDIDTGEEITYEEQGEDGNSKKTYREEMQGNVGERYVTEAKEIPYYKYLEDLKPTNGEGYYTEDDDTVMYYYRKLTFNISVEKNIVGATVNGEQAKIKDGKIIKLEVVASKALTTKVELKYEVVVKNTGELEGKAKVEENIPEGLKVSSKNPEYWKQEKGKLTKEVELEGGQEEKLEVVLEWKNSNTNFGNMNNIVKVVSTENPANYLETTEEDNTSEAEAIISVKTGANTRILAVALGTIASCGLLVLLYQYETYQKERGVAIRHVVLDGQNVVIVKKKQGKKAK